MHPAKITEIAPKRRNVDIFWGQIDKMTHTRDNEDIDPHANALSAGPASHGAEPDSSHVMRAGEVVNATDGNSSPRDTKSRALWSIVANQNEDKGGANTNEGLVDKYIDPIAKGAQHRDAVVPNYETRLFNAGSTHQPCDCACHDTIFNRYQADSENETIMLLKRRDAQHPSRGSIILPWQSRSNLLPCRLCSCDGEVDTDK
jgi:hypothetical protein